MQQPATTPATQPGDAELGQMTAAQAEAIARAVGVAKGPPSSVPEQQLDYIHNNDPSIPVVQASPVEKRELQTEEMARTSRKKKMLYISLLVCVLVGAAVLVAATVTTLYR